MTTQQEAPPLKILPPRGVKDVNKLSPRRQAEVAFAATSYEYHWKRADYTPHNQQLKFHALTEKKGSRYVAFIAGLGSGKSIALAAEVVKRLLQEPGSVYILAAPTYKMLASATKPAFFRILNEDAIHRYDKTDEVLTLTNGSTVWFRSTEDPDASRGIDASGFGLDEGAYSTGTAWNVLVGRLRKPGFTHKGFLSTTPRGMNWVWDRFASPAKPKGYEMVHASSRDNPFLTQDYIDSLNSTYAGRHREQEVEGRFVGFEGLVYNNFNPDLHILKDCHSEKFRREAIREVYYAHDWGFTNPMVILVFGVDGDGRLYAMDEFYEKGAVTGDVIAACKNFNAVYGEGPHICDPSEPGIIEEMSRQGFHMVGADNTILEGIARMAARFEPAGDGRPRLYVDERCMNFLMEVGNYRYEETKEGKPVKEKPLKLFDHAMDASRYMCSHLDQGVGSWGPPIDMTPLLDSMRSSSNGYDGSRSFYP